MDSIPTNTDRRTSFKVIAIAGLAQSRIRNLVAPCEITPFTEFFNAEKTQSYAKQCRQNNEKRNNEPLPKMSEALQAIMSSNCNSASMEGNESNGIDHSEPKHQETADNGNTSEKDNTNEGVKPPVRKGRSFRVIALAGLAHTRLSRSVMGKSATLRKYSNVEESSNCSQRSGSVPTINLAEKSSTSSQRSGSVPAIHIAEKSSTYSQRSGSVPAINHPDKSTPSSQRSGSVPAINLAEKSSPSSQRSGSFPRINLTEYDSNPSSEFSDNNDNELHDILGTFSIQDLEGNIIPDMKAKELNNTGSRPMSKNYNMDSSREIGMYKVPFQKHSGGRRFENSANVISPRLMRINRNCSSAQGFYKKLDRDKVFLPDLKLSVSSATDRLIKRNNSLGKKITNYRDNKGNLPIASSRSNDDIRPITANDRMMLPPTGYDRRSSIF